jgi:cytochrome oxidase assembly protein ShyY1
MTKVTQPKSTNSFRWQPNIKVLVLVALLLPLLLSLGFWQQQRAEEKQQLLTRYEQREMANPAVLGSLSPQEDLQYVRARVRGSFDNEKVILLDHRFYRGQPGYELLSPFQDVQSGRWLLVNRGWLPASLNRNERPQLKAVVGQVELVGHLYQPLGKPVVLAEEKWSGRWPEVVQNLDFQAFSQQLDLSLYPYTLRLDRGSAGALVTDWQIVNVQPEKHTGYAVQWFAMAFVLVILTVFVNSNLGALLRGAGDKNNE